MSALCFGDQVICEFLRAKHGNKKISGWGFLSADITQSGNIGMEKGGINNPPLELGKCLWTVEPVHQHCAFRELRSHMLEVEKAQRDLDRATKHSLIAAGTSGRNFAVHAGKDVEICTNRLKQKHKLTVQLKNALVQEIRFNDKVSSRRKGDPIAYGQPVSNCYFCSAVGFAYYKM